MNQLTAHWKPSRTLSVYRPDQETNSAGFVPLTFVVIPGFIHFELTQPDVVVGRHSLAEVRLADPDVSRRHCRLVFREGYWRVQDLNSLNGVYLNGQRIEDAVLYEGDRLTVGGCTLVMKKASATGHESDQVDSGAEVLQSIAQAMAGDRYAQEAG